MSGICVPPDPSTEPSGLLGDGLLGDGLLGEGGPGPILANPDLGMGDPARTVGSSWERAQQQGGVEPYALLVAELNGVQTELEIEGQDLSVTQTLDKPRWQATATLSRVIDTDVERVVTDPRTLFRLEVGWRFSRRDLSTIPYGVYELASAPKRSRFSGLQISLQDQWKRLDECRLTAPWTVQGGQTRAAEISRLVLAAIPGAEIVVEATGGTVGASYLVGSGEGGDAKDRAEAIQQLARDGGLYVSFDGQGRFVIQPDFTYTEPVLATFTDGPAATITEVALETKYTRLYNAVALSLTEEQVTAGLVPYVVSVPPTHPRAPQVIGLRPYFMSAPSTTSQVVANRAADNMLPKVLGDSEAVEVSTWGRGDLEPGNRFTTLELRTPYASLRQSNYTIQQLTYDPLEAACSITGLDWVQVNTEEA